MVRSGLIALLALLMFPLAAAAQTPDDGKLDPDFEGQVAYFGNYTGKTTVLASRDQRFQPQNCPYRDHRCYEQTVGGGVKVVLTFDGVHVTGFYISVDGFIGPNGLSSGTLVGRRTEAGCELFEADGTLWRASACDKREFLGQIISVNGTPKQSDVKFGTVGMYIRDTGRISKLIEEAERREGRIEWLRSRLGWGTPEERFRAAVELDSYSRYFRGIDPQRLSSPTQVPGRNNKRKDGKPWDIEATYERWNGGTGAVRGVILNGEVQCVQWEGRECEGIHPPIEFRPPTLDDDKGWLSRSTAPIAGPAPAPAK
ncbi:hypothetical protein ACFQ1E_12705 [Sphingomonas canadensis]|uniref:Uncharacterized protein n=1 Tax=Sphingomonas canadensis TaxID=1219257 RepID=A0ABW3H6Y2_9SPHN|nr:hypothetical protein [Sphingomonas canadensis]MCW3836663.1 hypothetical protein [Sphingomonas canadensis]